MPTLSGQTLSPHLEKGHKGSFFKVSICNGVHGLPWEHHLYIYGILDSSHKRTWKRGVTPFVFKFMNFVD